MNTLKTGAILLTIWSGLNLLVGVSVTLATLFARHTPVLALVLSDPEISRLDARAVAIINAQAALLNPCIAALCALVIAIVWTSLVRRARWACWALVGALVPVQVFGFVSDAYLGHRNLVANCFSTLLLLAGLAACGLALREPSVSGGASSR